MNKKAEDFPLPSFVALLMVQRDGLIATLDKMVERLKEANDLSFEDAVFWKAEYGAMLNNVTAINDRLAKYAENLKTENPQKETPSAEISAERFTPETASNCYLNYLDSKCLFFLVEEILKTLKAENNLSEVEKEYWLNRATAFREMSEMSLEAVKDEVEFYNREQAVSALVPFVSKAHLN